MDNIIALIPDIDTCMSQLSLFIGQFNEIVNTNNINVITDGTGNISIDVPSSMPVDIQDKLATKVGIVDRLISDRSSNLHELFKQGFEIEKNLRKNDPNYISVIAEKAKAFKELRNTYKH